MGGKGRNVSATLISIDEGELNETTVHFAKLSVSGKKEWPDWPHLCPVSESRALLYFSSGGMWYCDLKGLSLKMRKLKTEMPTRHVFRTVPIRIPDGKLLVVGALPGGTDITLISPDEEPTFERIGDIPGVARHSSSITLLADRFVVGFGGVNDNYLDDLWIFDVQTRKGYPLRKDGEWHPADAMVSLGIQHDTLYLVGGRGMKSVNSLTIQALLSLIKDLTARCAVCVRLGAPLPISTGIVRNDELDGVPAWL